MLLKIKTKPLTVFSSSKFQLSECFRFAKPLPKPTHKASELDFKEIIKTKLKDM